jgi:aminotransferase
MTISKKRDFNYLAANIQPSGIRATAARCSELGAVNLGQGVTDAPTPEIIKEAAAKAIYDNHNMYAEFRGIKQFREKIAQKVLSFNGVQVGCEDELFVASGTIGAFICAVKVLFNPGDEIIMFEPSYSYYKYILDLHQIKIIPIQINLNDLSVDLSRLDGLITAKTKAILVCTPNNPTGKVFSTEELKTIGRAAQKHNLHVIADELYEYFTYDNFKHVSIASLEDFCENTVTISGLSKTYNITGWRLGYAYGPKNVIKYMSLVHDLLFVCPPTPLQHAGIAALDLDNSYYKNLLAQYSEKRTLMADSLNVLRFDFAMPQGAYYLMVDFSALGKFSDDQDAIDSLLEGARVGAIAGRHFYSNPAYGRYKLRFCFALDINKVKLAMSYLNSYLGQIKTKE